MLAKRLVVVLAAFYEEAVLEQRRLRLFLVSASREAPRDQRPMAPSVAWSMPTYRSDSTL